HSVTATLRNGRLSASRQRPLRSPIATTPWARFTWARKVASGSRPPIRCPARRGSANQSRSDLLPGADLLGKDFEGDFTEPLAENRIELLNPKLIGQPACRDPPLPRSPRFAYRGDQTNRRLGAPHPYIAALLLAAGP